MGRFLSEKFSGLEPYVPGEQPQDMKYVKLNTNESPFPPTEGVLRAAAAEAGRLNLYSDPDCRVLREKAAALYGVGPENLLPVNGSDEILYFAFLAFGDSGHPFAFPDISYGFYPVFADICRVPARVIPLRDDFSIDPLDYEALGCNIVIANPNAPTGLLLTPAQVESIVASNPDGVVVIDEAYIDFGGQSCVGLINKYDNLLVTQTFSKSRSLAGARLGFGIGCRELIADLCAVKNSVNPYNINRMTQAAGAAAIADNAIYMDYCRTIAGTREYTARELKKLGFTVLPSRANFLFAAADWIDGGELYRRLKEMGVLVRHFDKERIENYCRITVGTREQMDILLSCAAELRQEKGAI